jgi:hypothetical protein
MKTNHDHRKDLHGDLHGRSVAVQSIYRASATLTAHWLTQIAVVMLIGRGPEMYESAQLRLEQAKLCDQTYAALCSRG